MVSLGKKTPLSRTSKIQPLCVKCVQQRYYRPPVAVLPFRGGFGWFRRSFERYLGGTGPVLPLDKKLSKHPNENDDILSIRTPFSMILGSLESQRRARQDHADKHHSPTMNHKTKCGTVKPLYKRQTGKTFNIKNAISFPYKICFCGTRAWYGDEHKL